ncbi:MAG: Asp-tRNA(Asn)/Glu-tRNA(Gln) amidotransferase subunit GatA [Deltaproteobacteria bacterium]|nr:Asp-tRNA(Asn)/Glu-tRNA(Gln) amidotransferase subunit GatA [Deltaproteobacteria bacterium]MBZ0219380.1 Asp-tRNA(Asn)/Glu-tRNA(Gln) amidotransferase subunit GatA [Deltaproteobacteria bacterium]
MDITSLDIRALSEKLGKKELSSTEATRAYLERIEKVEGRVSAFVTVTPEEALKAASEADSRISKGEDVTPLTGVPIAVKDIFCTRGVRTTCSSRILENFAPPYDAAVVKRLKGAGAVILGKNNMDEFAMGSSTENSAFKKTLNPWALDRVPGGSSGGSAAAVAASECAASIGTDTGGSIRQPASCCGVVGLKPTYGRVSRFGMIAFASSLDQAGPLTRSVEDAAIMLNAIAGHDQLDSTSIDAPVPDYTASLKSGIKGLRVGIPREYFIEGMDPDVEDSVRKALETIKALGAELVEISLPHTEYAVAVYYLVATAEASSNLARYDGVKYGLRVDEPGSLLDMYKRTRDEGFGPEVKRRIMLGTYSLSAGYYDAYYKKASQVRTLIKDDFEKAFSSCDIIATPTAPTAAFRIGEKLEDPLTMYLSDIFTISCNLAGIPGISLPCGFTKEGLPVGLQLLGRYLDEETVLRAAWSYENATEWKKRRPEL